MRTPKHGTAIRIQEELLSSTFHAVTYEKEARNHFVMHQIWNFWVFLISFIYIYIHI